MPPFRPQLDPDKIRARLDHLGMSNVECARRSGLSRQYICDILKGRRTASQSRGTRLDLASALSCPVRSIETTRSGHE